MLYYLNSVRPLVPMYYDIQKTQPSAIDIDYYLKTYLKEKHKEYLKKHIQRETHKRKTLPSVLVYKLINKANKDQCRQK